jgi:integration host factor subunit alpha
MLIRADQSNHKISHCVTRAGLADAVQQRLGLSTTKSIAFVEQVLREIVDTIAAGEDVKLRSFGSFHVRSKKERPGRNPKTGISAKVSARRVVTFKASRVLNSRVNRVAKTSSWSKSALSMPAE